MNTQTLRLGDKRFVVIEEEDFQRLLAAAEIRERELPPLPPADKHGNRPALAYARATLARKIILGRKALGWSQSELAKRARVRVETINRIERGRNTPDIATVDKIDKALRAAS
jgi:ribosome-binding protein aMBF1 (putative translation factor)